MEWIIISVVIYFIIKGLASMAGNNRQVHESYDADSVLEQANLGQLRVRTYSEYADLDDGDKLELFKTEVSGNLMVPYAGTECRLIYSITDVTEAEEPLPVVCYIEGLTDGESPLFFFSAPLTVAHQFSGIEGMQMPPVPPAALYLGRRGKRRLRMAVHIVNAVTDQIYGRGEAFTSLVQKDYGFLELGERNAKTDRAIAALGLAICVGDGHIDKRETDVIKRYFSEQFAGLEGEKLDKRKGDLNEALRELMLDAKERLATLSSAEIVAEIRKRAAVIAEFGSEGLNQAAYQLVMQIVAADDQLEESELTLIEVVANVLQIPDEVDQEMRDRYFKLAMFDNKEDQAAVLNMPGQLSVEEQKEFLNREYEKWRRRVTHKDPKVREEATARLEAVTKARRELEDA